jgi:hypothetical protein
LHDPRTSAASSRGDALMPDGLSPANDAGGSQQPGESSKQ